MFLPGLPATRGDCVDGARPCPYISCRYHLWAEHSGKAPLPSDSCVLDVADRGAATLAQVGDLLAVTRERIRQIEVHALARLERQREVAKLLKS